MRSVFILVLVLGVGLAGFAVYMAKGVLGDYEAALEAERAARGNMVPTVDVYVVNEKVTYGQQITEENIRKVGWPENAIPEGAFASLDELFPAGEKRFRTALRTMEKDEAVLAVKVTEPGHDAGVSSRLGAGMRAFAINVDATSGVSGFLAPGDRVDVYWTGRTDDGMEGNSREVTKLIQANVKIIAIDQRADIDRIGPSVARTVTVEGTSEEVARLNLAQLSGRLTLALVGHDDTTVAAPIEVDQDQLLGIERTVVAKPEAPKVCTVVQNRGGENVEVKIPCPTN
ncbi:MAG: Flp pilus assembly protein CpaB [Rhodobacterales bacterium]|nr:MAG: Flp pilus assembly protein CpaB [Rhodobacterales bacterium]